MEAYQERVVDERADLDGKLQRLAAFGGGSMFVTLPAEEQKRLRRQLAAMREYLTVLDERIAAWQA